MKKLNNICFLGLFLVVLFSACAPKFNYIENTKIEEILVDEPALTVSNKAGNYYNDLSVDIMCGNSDAKIYYTLDGSEPTVSDGILYSAPIMIKKTSTLSYRAFFDTTPITSVKKENYKFLIKKIDVKPASGEFTSDELAVSLLSETSDITIIYTTNGTNPSRENGSIYKGNIVINYFTILKFFAYKDGYSDTEIFRYAYSFKVLPPILNLFNEAEDIEIFNDTPIYITCDTPKTNIYYTLNGDIPSSNSLLYNGSIILTPNSLGDTIILKTNAYKYGFAYSELKQEKYVFKVTEVNMTPQPGSYDTAQTVTLSCALAGSSIYYTVNGSAPDSTATLYTTPINVNSETTIRAVAIKNGFKDSNEVTGIYKMQVSAPYFSAPSGTYKGSKTVTIGCKTSGATIRYIKTSDDSQSPDETSAIYDGVSPILVANGEIVKAIAYKSGISPSEIAGFRVTVNPDCLKVANPVLTPSSGSYSGKQKITVSCFDTTARI
ncbi:MAG TPA: chitobiase/beta-hexosaminidase C-terminal domain-containing protein, partial [Spirochaetota bacterium]|nr:chitobiase/beta-hexosaminidase C-terminal domain-containing protein [Spirochaetota bacterium]